MGQIIAFGNRKGGVGKTTLTIHMAAYLQEQGCSVIVVDGDSQGNASSWLLDADITSSGLYDVLIARQSVGDVLRPTKWENVRLFPSNDETSDAMTILVALQKPFETVAEKLRPLAGYADYVLIDMPPSKAAGFKELLYAADWVFVPTLLERMSLEGVTFMYRVIQELKEEHDNAPRLLAVVPNIVRQRTNEHQEHMNTLVNTLGSTVWPAIRESIRVSEATTFGTTVFDFAPNENVAADFRKVGERFVENLGAYDG